MTPRIGVTPCRALPDYLESVRLAGAEPIVLDYAAHPPADALAHCRGILFTGGGDIDPACYGEAPHASVSGVDASRDAYELELAGRALAADLPVLAICRGLQVLNVAAGGTLIQDIPSAIPGGPDHVVKTPLFAIAHDVAVTTDSRLAALMGPRLGSGATLAVNSRHHQAVRTLASGFVVTATAPDGIVEAFEHPGRPFVVAVQWQGFVREAGRK